MAENSEKSRNYQFKFTPPKFQTGVAVYSIITVLHIT